MRRFIDIVAEAQSETTSTTPLMEAPNRFGTMAAAAALALGVPAGSKAQSSAAPTATAATTAVAPSVQTTPQHPLDLATLAAVNVRANRSTVFTPEAPGEDVWQLPKHGYGDCEDIALLKRKLLMDMGWPESDLSMMIVTRPLSTSRPGRDGATSQKEGHVVLFVKSLGVVLDSPLEGDQDAVADPIPWEKWSKDGHWSMYCTAVDLSPHAASASARCGRGPDGKRF